MTEMIPAWIDGVLQPVEKLEVHRKGLKHKAVSVFVMDGSKVLIQKRAATKYHSPGLWANTCCTHPHWQEDPVSCGHRRLHEELGISGLTLTHRDFVEYRADVGNGLTEHELVDIYVAERTPQMTLRLNPAEVEATRWIELTELSSQVSDRPQDFSAWVRIYLRDHLDTIFANLARA